MAHVLVLLAHPDLPHSRANRLMAEAAQGAQAAEDAADAADIEQAGRPGQTVQVRDLARLYPDFDIDVPAEQAQLARADLVVWQHPTHWYGMPALMKQWVDEVLTFGWAYGPGGTALRGKDLWLATTTGGPESAYRPDGYNRYFFDAFLPPYEQTAALCGMRFLPPLVLHGAQAAGDAELQAHARLYADRLARYPDWPEMADLPACPACSVPSADRPADDPSGRRGRA